LKKKKGEKMKVEKAALLSAMKKALPGVEKGSSTIEGADTFVFQMGILSTYNDNISVSIPLHFKGEIKGAVKSMDFFKLISKMPTDELNIESGESNLKINSGSVEAEMVLIGSNIPDYLSELRLDELKWKELPTNFFGACRLCKITGNRAPQRGIFVEGGLMVSTDISRINQHKLSTEMDRFWLDDPAVIELLKISGLTHYAIADSWANFKGEDGTVFSCKRKDDTGFPVKKINKIIEDNRKQDEDIENVLPKGLFTVADRVSTLSGEMDGLPAVQMTIKKDCIEFYAERYAGKIRETIPFEKPFEKDINLKLYVDPFFLTEASKKVSNFYLKTMTVNEKKINVLVFYNENYTQVASTFKGDE
jgi:hypothetical protein